jgi:hypothetical protein
LLVFFLVRWANNYLFTTRLQANAFLLKDKSLQQFIHDKTQLLKINRTIRIYVTEKVISPLTVGFIKPIILLPIASINNLSTEQLETILLHELAHIKRLDFVWNIISTIVTTILFFNPFAHFINATLAKEREYSCDDWVLRSNYQPVQYANALLHLAQLQSNAALALTAVSGKQQLLQRIQRMLGMLPYKKDIKQSTWALAGIVTLFVLGMCLPNTAIHKKTLQSATQTTNHFTAVIPPKKFIYTVANTTILKKKENNCLATKNCVKKVIPVATHAPLRHKTDTCNLTYTVANNPPPINDETVAIAPITPAPPPAEAMINRKILREIIVNINDASFQKDIKLMNAELQHLMASGGMNTIRFLRPTVNTQIIISPGEIKAYKEKLTQQLNQSVQKIMIDYRRMEQNENVQVIDMKPVKDVIIKMMILQRFSNKQHHSINMNVVNENEESNN